MNDLHYYKIAELTAYTPSCLSEPSKETPPDGLKCLFNPLSWRVYFYITILLGFLSVELILQQLYYNLSAI